MTGTASLNASRDGPAEGALHARIRSEIEQKIMSGEWGPGERIPYEHELMNHYECSRMTVNRAMASLAEAGLIDRRRRAGSFVARPRIHSAVLSIPDIKAEITERGALYGFDLIAAHKRPAKPDDSLEQQLSASKPLLAITCLHLADDRPFAFEQRLISLAAVPEAASVDFRHTPPGGWLLSHVPWTEAEHRITAVNADDNLAAVLEIDLGAACLALERRTWRGDEHITYVKQTFAGDAYDLVAKFGPGA